MLKQALQLRVVCVVARHQCVQCIDATVGHALAALRTNACVTVVVVLC